MANEYQRPFDPYEQDETPYDTMEISCRVKPNNDDVQYFKPDPVDVNMHRRRSRKPLRDLSDYDVDS